MIVNNIITTIMEIKGKVNTDTINVHKGELMEYKNQTENRAFREMLHPHRRTDQAPHPFLISDCHPAAPTTDRKSVV